MHYFEFEPAPALAAHVASYWGMSVGADVPAAYPHQIIPDGCISLVFGRTLNGAPRASILGPRIEALTVPVNAGDRYWGVRFWPDAGSAVLGIPARELKGRVVAPIADPAWAASLAFRMGASLHEEQAAETANTMLPDPIAATPALDPLVRSAVVGLIASRGEMTVAELSSGLGVSARQLERRFGAAVGLTPKQFARIRRLRSALSHLLDPVPKTWSQVAADLGYADHSHLTRDMMNLSGMTPSALAAKVRAISHGKVRP